MHPAMADARRQQYPNRYERATHRTSNAIATGPFLRRERSVVMFASLLVAAALIQSPADARALQLCKAGLARKAGGEINRITIDSATASGRTKVIRGQVSVFVGMPPAPPGSARAHHLIRADYHYNCQVRHGRIVEATLVQP
jgi:hypothetical protein